MTPSPEQELIMSEAETIPVNTNDQLALIVGASTGGKSASLRNIRNQQDWMYLNCEAGKRLPFRNKFDSYTISDPYQVHEGMRALVDGTMKREGVIVDTLTFLMEMFETQYVIRSANTMDGWQQYQQFFKTMMQEMVSVLPIPVLFLAHVKDELDEKAMEIKTTVPIKGALKNNGIEAYFSTVVSAKRMDLKTLEAYGSDLLTITDEDKELGYKHVFQTRPTAKTVGERIRSPMGMFSREQTFMDNDAQLLLDHLDKFYSH